MIARFIWQRGANFGPICARIPKFARTIPRGYIHHPSLDVVYFSNEQGCSVTAYRIDGANGTLSSVQTTSTLPARSRSQEIGRVPRMSEPSNPPHVIDCSGAYIPGGEDAAGPMPGIVAKHASFFTL
jgi:Lactonase, 7-bladed beta-propeller